MKDGAIARRYARALADALTESEADASKGRLLQQVDAELSATARALAATGPLRHATFSPAFKPDDRTKIFAELAEAHGFHPITARFLQLLIEKGRMRSLTSIAAAFRTEADSRLNQVRASVIAAKTVDEGALDRLVKLLEAKTGKKVIPEVNIDPDVIGGLSAQIGGLVYDGTVRAQLLRLQQEIV